MKLAIISDLHGNLPVLRGNQRRQLLALLALPAGQIDRASSDRDAASRLSPAHAAWHKVLPVSMALNRDVSLCHGTPRSDLADWLETVVPGFAQGHGPGMRAAQRVSRSVSAIKKIAISNRTLWTWTLNYLKHWKNSGFRLCTHSPQSAIQPGLRK